MPNPCCKSHMDLEYLKLIAWLSFSSPLVLLYNLLILLTCFFSPSYTAEGELTLNVFSVNVLHPSITSHKENLYLTTKMM